MGIEYQVSGIGYRVSGFEFSVLGFRISGFGFRVSVLACAASRVWGFRFQFSGFGFRVSSFGFGEGDGKTSNGRDAPIEHNQPVFHAPRGQRRRVTGESAIESGVARESETERARESAREGE